MGENFKTSLIEDEAKEDVPVDNWDGNEFTKSQIEALENLESSELDISTATSTTTIKLELLKKPSNRSILVLKP